MANLTPDDMHVLDLLFQGPRSDRVLDFDDQAFVDFFQRACEIDVASHPYYVLREREYVSWADQMSCLRKFYDQESDEVVGKAIELLVSRAKRLCEDGKEKINPLRIEEGYAIARRLQGVPAPYISAMAKSILENPSYLMATQRGISAATRLIPSSLALSLQKRANAIATVNASIYSPEMIKTMENYFSYRKNFEEQMRPVIEVQEKLREQMRPVIEVHERLREQMRPVIEVQEKLREQARVSYECFKKISGAHSFSVLEMLSQDAFYPSLRHAHVRNAEKDISEKHDFVFEIIGEINFDKSPISEKYKPTVNDLFDQMRQCVENGIYHMAILAAGGVLESMLVGYAIKHPEKFEHDRNIEELGLGKLTEIYEKAGILTGSAKWFSDEIRILRNYIHPARQVSDGFKASKEHAEECLLMLRVILRRLK